MAIEFDCACGKLLRVDDESAGKRAKCPACLSLSNVPDLATEDVAFRTLMDAPEPIRKLAVLDEPERIKKVRRLRRETEVERRRPWIAFSPAMIWGMLYILIGVAVYFISDWLFAIYALPLLIFGTVAVVRGLMGKEED
jgi:hypothetical protein